MTLEINENEKNKTNRITDYQCNERTFLAWIRTSIGIMAFGFVVEKFGLFVKQLTYVFSLDPNHPNTRLLHSQINNSSFLGISIVGLGLLLILLAFISYKRVEKQIREGNFQQSFILGTLLTLSIFTIGIFLMIYLIHSS